MNASPPPLTAIATRLDIRDLRVVLALAREGTTAKASAVLHLTQPAVSRALQAAEEKLGIQLFARTPRGLVPTAAGDHIVAGAAKLLLELRDLEHRARAPAPKPTRVRLVCECYTAYHWLPAALGRVRSAIPGLEVRLEIQHTNAPAEALAQGEIDLALLTSSPVPPGDFVERALLRDEIVFLVAADHPLAAKKALGRVDLQKHTILTSPVPPGEATWFARAVFGRARPRLRVEQLPVTEPIVELARAGMGIAILSEWIASPYLGRGDLVIKRLSSGPLMRPWRMAWARSVDDAAKRLRAAIQAGAPRSPMPA